MVLYSPYILFKIFYSKTIKYQYKLLFSIKLWEQHEGLPKKKFPSVFPLCVCLFVSKKEKLQSIDPYISISIKPFLKRSIPAYPPFNNSTV